MSQVLRATTRFRSKPNFRSVAGMGHGSNYVRGIRECVAASLKGKDQNKYQHLQHDSTGYDKIENTSDNSIQINNYAW